MGIEIIAERKGLVMKVVPHENFKQEIDFPRNDIADLQTNYTGASPYHLNYCGYEHCHPGYAFGPHTRASYLMHIVTRGSGRYYVNNKIYQICAGQIFLIYPGITTTYQADQDDPWSYYWIGFSGYQANYILSQMGFSQDSHVITVAQLDPLIQCIERMLQSYEFTLQHELQRTSELLHFFACVLNSRPQSLSSSKPSKAQYAEAAMRYISNHFDQKIQISALADYIGIDRSYLSKIFREEYQISPQEYLLRLRIQKATTLLVNTNYTISDIASRCGYSDALAFTKIFHQRIGCSPKEYRSSQKNQCHC